MFRRAIHSSPSIAWTTASAAAARTPLLTGPYQPKMHFTAPRYCEYAGGGDGDHPPGGLEHLGEAYEVISPGVSYSAGVDDGLGFHLPPEWARHQKQQHLQHHPCGKRPREESAKRLGGGGAGDSGPLVGQAVSTLCLSPVCEAMGCLWQWRPVRIAWGQQQQQQYRRGSSEAHSSSGGSDTFFMVPFLLLAAGGAVLAQVPMIHEETVSTIYNYHHKGQPHAHAAAARPCQVVVPSPLGDLLATVGHHPPPSLRPQGQGGQNGGHGGSGGRSQGQGQQAKDHSYLEYLRHREAWTAHLFDLLCDHSAAAAAAATAAPQGGQPGGPAAAAVSCYEAVYHAKGVSGNSTTAAAPNGAEPRGLASSSSTFTSTSPSTAASSTTTTTTRKRTECPAVYKNVITGGLAELIIATDRYAALIARQELTLAAACWALLCDVKLSAVLPAIRMHAVELEQEVLRSVDAHVVLHRMALAKHKTMVGMGSGAVMAMTDVPHMLAPFQTPSSV